MHARLLGHGPDGNWRAAVAGNANVALVEPEHLSNKVSPALGFWFRTCTRTYLLWAPPVNDLLGVLRLLAVLPGQVDDEGAVLLVLAHVHRVNLFVPAAARGLPLDRPCGRGRRRVCGVAVLAGALLGGGG